MLKTFGALLVGALLFACASAAQADDAARDWSQSMGYSSPSAEANAFNRALAIFNARRGGGGAGGSGNTFNCSVAGACPQGGTVTQWNGVTVYDVRGGAGNGNITIDNDIDADSHQGAGIATCVNSNDCNANQ